MPDTTASPAPASAFADLDAFAALPRVSGLALSHDGTRLVTTVATLTPDGTRWRGALWEVDPAGRRPAHRLTRGRTAESSPVFAPDGSLLFTSARPDAEAGDAPDDPPAALWALPATGEARCVASRPGGVSGPRTARTSAAVVVASDTLPGADDSTEGPTSDAARRKARKDATVNAVLHTGYPVRYWDADLGPGEPRWLTLDLPARPRRASGTRCGGVT